MISVQRLSCRLVSAGQRDTPPSPLVRKQVLWLWVSLTVPESLLAALAEKEAKTGAFAHSKASTADREHSGVSRLCNRDWAYDPGHGRLLIFLTFQLKKPP